MIRCGEHAYLNEISSEEGDHATDDFAAANDVYADLKMSQ